MNRLEQKFSLKGEARLKYASGEYQVLSPGEFVRCAVTGVPIGLDELRYWNVELQEAYATARIAWERHREIMGKTKDASGKAE